MNARSKPAITETRALPAVRQDDGQISMKAMFAQTKRRYPRVLAELAK